MFKIAIVGLGGMSAAWLKVLTQRPDCEITALVDIIPAAAEKRREEYKLDARVFTSIDDALAAGKYDVVVNITIPELHFEIVSKALRAGCDVLGEKPMAATLEEAAELNRIAAETGKRYIVMQNRRYDPNIIGLRDFLRNGYVGKIGFVSADFYMGAHFGGFRDEMASPLVIDMAIHTFDQARFITGAAPLSVYCHDFNPPWSWYKGNASAVCIYTMSDGSVFEYRGSWCTNGTNTTWESQWRVECENGSAFWDGARDIYFQRVDQTDTGFTRKTAREEIAPFGEMRTGHDGCINDMLDCLRDNRTAQTDGRDNIKSLAMVYKALESAKLGRVVEF